MCGMLHGCGQGRASQHEKGADPHSADVPE